MGQSTDAILAYGFEIHSPDEGWLTHEPDEHIEAQSWYKTECFEECAEAGDECDCEPDLGEILTLALKGTPLSVVSHCHRDYPVWMIVAHSIRAWRGDPKYLDLTALTNQANGWSTQFNHLWQKLGITPTQVEPRWILASDWG